MCENDNFALLESTKLISRKILVIEQKMGFPHCETFGCVDLT